MTRANNKTARGGGAISRRTFIGKTATVAGTFTIPTIIPASALGADGHMAPSNRITMAQIGIGSKGRGHLRSLLFDPSVEILALCDVDRVRLEVAKAMVEDAK